MEKWDHYLPSVTAKKNGAEKTQVYGMRHISALKLVPNKVIGANFFIKCSNQYAVGCNKIAQCPKQYILE